MQRHRQNFISATFLGFVASLAFGLSAPCLVLAGDPYLRVGLFVEEREEDGGTRTGDCLSFAPEIPPGDGKFLRLYADSNVASALMILAVDRRTRDVSSQWPPKLWVQEESFSEIIYPLSANSGIPYRADTGLDLFVVSIPLAFADLDKLKNNLAQLEKLSGAANEQVFLLRAASVREQVERWFQDQNKATCVAQYRPPAKAATQRSGSAVTILWREQHLVHKFAIADADKPFVARIPVVPAEAAPEPATKPAPTTK